MVGHQRQHDERGGRKQQQVMELVLGEGVTHEAVKALPVGEQQRHDHGRPRGERGIPLGERTEQEAHDQRYLGRDARVLLAAAEVGGDRRERDEGACDRNDRDATDAVGETAEQSDEGECADARWPARAAPALAPLTLEAEQQADPQRNGQRGRRAHRSGGSGAPIARLGSARAAGRRRRRVAAVSRRRRARMVR